MSENTKDFIKFVSEVMIFLTIVATIFSAESIASDTFNYMIFAEPIMLQNYIATTSVFASVAPGNFSSTVKTTGEAYTIEFSKSDEVNYVNVAPPRKLFTKFSALNPLPFITNCTVNYKTLKLKSKLNNFITIRKIATTDSCNLYLETAETGIIEECGDRIDNDGDGLIDSSDPSCHSDYDVSNYSTYNPSINDEASGTYQCMDKRDNDFDNLIDSVDPGCHDDENPLNESSFNSSRNSEYNNFYQCNNGIDDDNDGRTDNYDSGCHIDYDRTNINSYNATRDDESSTECSDGTDNDGDTKVDYPDDTCCQNLGDNDETNYQCCDGIDNDGDGKIDLNDPSCQGNPDGDNEAFAPPQCSDSIDNDGDNFIDYPADLGCNNINDNDETNPPLPISEFETRIIECGHWSTDDCRFKNREPDLYCKENLGTDWFSASVDCETIEIEGADGTWKRSLYDVWTSATAPSIGWCTDTGGEDMTITCTKKDSDTRATLANIKIVVIECSGDCRDKGWSPESKCKAEFGNNWHALTVDCELVDIKVIPDGIYVRTLDQAWSGNENGWCPDTGGEDMTITCTDKPLIPANDIKTVVVECSGDCSKDWSPDSICTQYVGAGWQGLAVDCQTVEVKNKDGNWTRLHDQKWNLLGATGESISWCYDEGSSSGEDMTVTCVKDAFSLYYYPTQCSDATDNDGNGLNNADDPGCHNDYNAANAASYNFNDIGEGPCGNGIKEGIEECDNMDFGGKTCNDYIPTSVGVLNCIANGQLNECKVDSSNCNIPAGPCVVNGICDTSSDETFANCPADCFCNNNNVCEILHGETFANCPADCSCNGDLDCDNLQGENCLNCPGDCTCPHGEHCCLNNGECSFSSGICWV